MNNFVNRLKSRKLILALIGALVAFLNAYFELGLTTEQVWSVIAPLLAFIGAEGVADAVERNQSPIIVETPEYRQGV